MRAELVFLSAALLACTGSERPHDPSRVAANGAAMGEVIPADRFHWEVQTPGLPIQRVTLWGDPDHGAFGELVKLPGGFDSRLHAHTGDYRAVLVSGVWIHVASDGSGNDRELLPGSYVLQPGKGMHVDKCKVGAECVLFLFQTEKPDILWPPK